MKMPGWRHSKILIPLIIFSLIAYFTSFWLSKVYFVVPLISVLYFIAADIIISGAFKKPVIVFEKENLIVIKGKKFNAFSGGIFNPFTVITDGAYKSQYRNALVEHESGHRKSHHAFAENMLILCHSLILAAAIKNNQLWWAFPVAVGTVFFLHYLFHVLFEISADAAVEDKNMLREYLKRYGSKSLCNKIRIQVL